MIAPVSVSTISSGVRNASFVPKHIKFSGQ
jgi:hypothetical protein